MNTPDKTLEEAAIRILQKESGHPFLSEIKCFKLGSDWQSTQSANRIVELEKALQAFLSLETLINYNGKIKEEHYGEAEAINNAFRLAKSAFNKEKQ